MNVCKASGIAFLCFVSLCSLHGMESDSNSSSESKESVGSQEQERERQLSLINAIVNNKARVRFDDDHIIFSHYQERDKEYSSDIETVHADLSKMLCEGEELKGKEEKEPKDYFKYCMERFAYPDSLPFDLLDFFEDNDLPDSLSMLYESQAVLGSYRDMLFRRERSFGLDPEGKNITDVANRVNAKVEGLKTVSGFLSSRRGKRISDDRNKVMSEMVYAVRLGRLELLRALRDKDMDTLKSTLGVIEVQLTQIVDDSDNDSDSDRE